MSKLNKKHSPLSRSELKLIKAGKAAINRDELFKVHTDVEGNTKIRRIRRFAKDA
jgi:hypothetical protein